MKKIMKNVYIKLQCCKYAFIGASKNPLKAYRMYEHDRAHLPLRTRQDSELEVQNTLQSFTLYLEFGFIILTYLWIR